MFRAATGESWNGLMHDCMLQPNAPHGPQCSEEAGDCGSWVAIPFFVSHGATWQQSAAPGRL